MNTINCRIKLNEHQDVPVKGCTPAEAVVLRFMHDPSAHKYSATAQPREKRNFWKMFSIIKPAGVAKTEIRDEEDKVVEAHDRTAEEELARLRAKYPVRAKNNQPGTHLLDDLYPGINPKLPESFEEVGFMIDAPKEEGTETAAALPRCSATHPESGHGCIREEGHTDSHFDGKAAWTGNAETDDTEIEELAELQKLLAIEEGKRKPKQAKRLGELLAKYPDAKKQ